MALRQAQGDEKANGDDKKKIPREGRRTGDDEEVRVIAQIRFEILDLSIEKKMNQHYSHISYLNTHISFKLPTANCLFATPYCLLPNCLFATPPHSPRNCRGKHR